MKRVVVLMILLLLIGQNSWAARAKVTPIVGDPYVSALVMDASTGKVLFSEKPDTPVYPASVVKLMDLLVILERIERGDNRLDEMVPITREAAKIGGSQVYLDPKEQFSIEDLLYALMVQSANDAAVALAIHIAGSKDGFVDLMNKKAAELGMKNSHFYSVHGLPPGENQNPDQTTAHDLAILSRALVQRPDAVKITGTQERGFRDNTFIMRNHNHLLGDFFGCDGLKTGYYSAAGFSIAATAQRDGNRVIAVVMGSKDRKVRDAKASELLAKGFAMLPSKPEQTVADSQPAVPQVKPAQPGVAVSVSTEEDDDVVENAPAAPAEPPVAAKTEEAKDECDKFQLGTFLFGILVGLLVAAVIAFFRKGRTRHRTPTYLR